MPRTRRHPATRYRASRRSRPRRLHPARRAPSHRSWPGTGGHGCRRSGSRPSGSPTFGSCPTAARPTTPRGPASRTAASGPARSAPTAESGREAWATSSSRPTAPPRPGRSPGCRSCVAASECTWRSVSGQAQGPLHLRDRPHPQYVVPLPGLPGAAVGRRPGTPRPDTHPRDGHAVDLRHTRGPRCRELLGRRVRQPRAPDRQDRRARRPAYVMTATSRTKLSLPVLCNAREVAVSHGTRGKPPPTQLSRSRTAFSRAR